MAHFVLESFNPYADRYPERRVVSRSEFDLIKIIRAEGFKVDVTGDPSHELNFLTKKGMSQLLADPLFLFAISIPINVVCGLFANALPQWFKARNATATDVVIEIDEAGRKARFTADGAPIDNTKFELLMTAMKERQLSHAHAALVKAPDPSRPLPIFLEHTDFVIGWGRVEVGDDALLVRDAEITDDETLSKIRDGTLTGFSIGGLVREAECSICGKSYFECDHIGHEVYKGKVCTVRLTNVDLAEISIVKDPVNPEAQIHWQGNP